jgi:Prokaryotic Cytochrome C oxidase subunit IV
MNCMTTTTTSRLTIVLTLIVSVTVLSWFLGTGGGQHPTAASLAISAAVIFIALLKVRIIMREFMEVGRAPAWVRWTSDVWLVLFFAAPFVVHFAVG